MTETKRVSDEKVEQGARLAELTKPERRNEFDNLYLDLRDLRLAHAKAMAVVEAARMLNFEVRGSFPLMEPLARREFGNTNYTCIMRRSQELTDALSALNPTVTKEPAK